MKYVFVDYPIAQLHPDAFKSHEAAHCAGDQGKVLADARQPVHEPAGARRRAVDRAGEDARPRRAKFDACLNGERHAAAIRESIARMQQLGVDGTPLMLIGLTPAPGRTDEVVSSIYGARPYADFKAAIDAALAQAGIPAQQPPASQRPQPPGARQERRST